MKNQFWAVGCGLGWTVKKKVWADYEQLLRPVFLSFHGQKINSIFFENIVGSALKSFIE
jgi:hypothetical protein